MIYVAVIGGGAAGLAAVSYLTREEGIHVTLFEERSEFGGVWTNQSTTTQPSPMYEGLETNVPHTMMTFTDHQWPRDTPVFPPHEQVRTYLRTYAQIKVENESSANITYYRGQKVVDLRQLPSGQWKIKTKSNYIGLEDMWDAVVVAAGNYNDPHITDPELGREAWLQCGYLIMHSSSFTNAECFTDKVIWPP